MAGAISWLEFAQYAMVRKVSIWNCGIRNTWYFGFAIFLYSMDNFRGVSFLVFSSRCTSARAALNLKRETSRHIILYVSVHC